MRHPSAYHFKLLQLGTKECALLGASAQHIFWLFRLERRSVIKDLAAGKKSVDKLI